MNTLQESAVVALLLDYGGLVARVGNRVSWDDIEPDTPFPCVTLRLLTTAIPGQLATDSELRNPLIEVSAHAASSTDASLVLDDAIAAIGAHRNRTTVPVGSPAQSVVIAGVRLVDVQQAPSPRERCYRKVAVFSFWLEG